ncbi:V-ATPase V0 sector subunit c'' [Pleodorina starrii]|uniref:inorganic diphosphatase n=1 Tax=Pleodorina starrii TaxID=330485 RepID=A0A9W6BHH9_9CHLO|nr:V-ATPase V0 sector subunit c'' [Pleodorina starrii]
MALAIRGLRTCAAGRGIRQALSQRVVPAPVQPFRVRPVATASTAEVTAYTNVEKGDKDTLEYRMFFKQGAKEVSCWHEIPLHAGNGLLHYICEIPKETSAKMEVATDEPCTPIKQDVKKGKLRFYPYNINWNYGMLPQTWEDPGTTNPDLQAAGDNDPVDVVEIGSATAKRGGVYKVKPVGVLAMIDDGELDWKVIAVAADDPKADLVNDVEDVEKHFPGEIQKVLEWFRDYKIPDGKPANKFGYDNKCMNKEFTMHVIQETHEAYVKLKSGARANTEELSLI